MPRRSIRLSLIAAMTAIAALLVTSEAALAHDSGKRGDDPEIHQTGENFKGGDPGPKHTVQTWTGVATNPENGVTYRYRMVGVDPRTNRSATIGVDIIPLVVNAGGQTFDGSESVAGVLASPLFHSFDFSSTIYSTRRDPVTGVCCVVRPAGGTPFPLSSGNTGQLLDATMRAEFDKVGSRYHLYLDVHKVHDPITIDVPSTLGNVITSPVGVPAASVDSDWFQARVEGLLGELHLNPKRLAMFLTTDVVTYKDHNPAHCCALGGHGAVDTDSHGDAASDSNRGGDHSMQTLVWASWFTPGLFGPKAWVMKDIVSLSHEVTEWAMDPFLNNEVQPWISTTAPQYGCVSELETGDPTVNIGFSVGLPGANVYDKNPFASLGAPRNPFSDGTFHVEDEAFIPWFMRFPEDNEFSQPTQSGAGGRYTLMGDLNPIAQFHQPAASC